MRLNIFAVSFHCNIRVASDKKTSFSGCIKLAWRLRLFLYDVMFFLSYRSFMLL